MDLQFLKMKKDEAPARFVDRVIKGVQRLRLSPEQSEFFQAIFRDETIPYEQRVEDAERLLTIMEKNSADSRGK